MPRIAFPVFATLLLASLAAAAGQAPQPYSLAPLPPTTPQGVEGGVWRTDGDYEPILHLKNILITQPLNVTPEIFFADGTEFDLPVMQLEPAGVASVNIKIALQNLPPALSSHLSSFGMVGISYQWSWPAVMASLQNLDEIASLSGASGPIGRKSVVHQIPEAISPQVIRGTWWLPTQTSDEVIAVGNTSLATKQVKIQFSDSTGNVIAQKQFSIASHSSTLLRLDDLLSGSANPGNAGGVTIVYSGASHAIVASASIEDGASGFSFSPRMLEQVANPDEDVHQVTLHAPGLMLGKAYPAMLFPENTVFTPYAVLHNVSDHPVTAAISLTSNDAGGNPITRSLDTITLTPDAVMKLDMSRYFNTKTPLPNGYGHLSVSYNGRYNDLLFNAGSVDQSLDYVFQVMPAGEAPTTGKIFCLWSVEDDTSTMISIWNYANQEQDATLTLQYHGGQYRIPLHLGPRQTYNLDMMTLVKSRVPDADGNLIPDNIKSGSATLVGPKGELDTMTVVTSASTYNVRNATCYPICIDCGGLQRITLPNYSVLKGSTVQATATETLDNGSTSPLTSGSWTSNNTSIATVNTSGVVTGVVGGSTTIYSPSVSAPQGGETQCFQQNQTVCPYFQWQASGTVTVYDSTPVITGISPSTWNAGTTTPSVTITGRNFGTNTPSLSFSPGTGITYVLHAAQDNDNQIVADIIVAAGTPSEGVNVTVTNNGYGGNAFNGQSGGQSAQSSPAQANVQAAPAKATIYQNTKTTYANQTFTSCDGKTVDPNSYGYGRCVFYQIDDSSGNPIYATFTVSESVNVIVENIAVTLNTGNSMSNSTGDFGDDLHLISPSPLPANACSVLKQTFSVSGNTIRVNCLQFSQSDVTINDVTANPSQCSSTNYSCP